MTMTLTLPHKTKAWRFMPLIAAVFVFIGTVAVLNPIMPFTLSEGLVENQPVRAGDEIKVDWTQTWRRRCRAESVRSIVRADHKIDTYEKAMIYPPSQTGAISAKSRVKLSKIMPEGEATYRADVTFPTQLSWRCWFTTNTELLSRSLP